MSDIEIIFYFIIVELYNAIIFKDIYDKIKKLERRVNNEKF